MPRFVADDEVAAYFRRADLVVLPYREIDQSGVLSTALAFGAPLCSARSAASPRSPRRRRRARRRPATRARCAASCGGCSATRAARAALAAGARAAAAGRYSWDAIAAAHLALYETLR